MHPRKWNQNLIAKNQISQRLTGKKYFGIGCVSGDTSI